jgi:hypothetical protein
MNEGKEYSNARSQKKKPTQRPQRSDRKVHEVWLAHQKTSTARISVLQSEFTRAAKVHHSSSMTLYMPSLSYLQRRSAGDTTTDGLPQVFVPLTWQINPTITFTPQW